MTNIWTRLYLSLGILLPLLAFQNCAEFIGGDSYEFALAVPEEAIPECRDLTSSNFQPKLDFTWSSSSNFPTFDQVMSSPSVGDINGDGFPEIAFTTYAGGNYFSTHKGVLRVIDGKSRAEIISIGSDSISPSASVAPLLIDIDRDGKGEIIFPHYKNNEIVALNYNGTLRWKVATSYAYNCYGGLSAADFNKDGKAEIIKNGEVLFEQKNLDGSYTVNVVKYKNNGSGCSHFAMNLNSGEGSMSIIDSTGVYFISNGSFTFKFLVNNLTCELLGCSAAAADVDPNYPGKEIIYTGFGTFRIYSSEGRILVDKNLTDQNPEDQCIYQGNPIVGGGTATIGEFDGNKSTTEFAIATGRSLTIYDKAGNKIAGASTKDCSSLSTGVTSFDFNGDGKPEILYADEEKFRVYQYNTSARKLDVIWEVINTSGTLHEYPVVVDLNQDFSPEIIVVSNSLFVPAGTGNNGLRIFTAPSADQKWMPTRNIWNQHNYFISNVDNGLRAPSSTSINDEIARNFRRNLPGKDIRCK